jgi:hypothetical protein
MSKLHDLKKGITSPSTNLSHSQKAGPINPLMIPPRTQLTDLQKCNYPDWKQYLDKYPKIHLIQRIEHSKDRFTEIMLLHYFESKNTDEETRDDEQDLVEEIFEKFFTDVGFTDSVNDEGMDGLDNSYFGVIRNIYWDDILDPSEKN